MNPFKQIFQKFSSNNAFFQKEMDIPEVIFPGAQDHSTLQRRFEGGQSQGVNTANLGGNPPQGQEQPPKPKVPNIYVKKPHRKQPALGLFLAKADPEDREDWRLKSGILSKQASNA